ncbi:MAG: class I SAM-dependent methyltransferase [Actinomycetota bacterium]
MKAHPVFARVWDQVVRLGGRTEMANRRELVRGIEGRVLEVGAGTGLNFRLYPSGVSVFAVEPEPIMARKAAERARAATASVRVARGVAEALPFPDGLFDAVVACYVLCSVADPLRALSEIRRVLRVGGDLRVYEHVRSEASWGARVQDVLTPLWHRCGCNCHPNRDTVATLRRAGFEVDVRPASYGPPTPVRPHVLGVARLRPADPPA